MKYYRLLLVAVTFAMTASCADEFKAGYEVEKPESIAIYEYLNAYDALKTYINRNTSPNFKLGAGVTVSEFLEKKLVYSLMCANFDRLTAGNAMKYSSCVSNDGTMNFSQVVNFVGTAQEAGLAVYGHTLCWHSQQNIKYLNGLIAPTVVPGEAGDGGYCLILHNETLESNNYSAQTWYELSGTLTQGVTYTLTCKAKATEEYSTSIYLQGGSQGYPGALSLNTTWADVSLSFTPSHGETNKIAFNFGNFVGKIYIDDIKLTAAGSNVNLIANSDFEDGNIAGWTGWTPGRYEIISDNGEGYVSGGGSSDSGYCLNFTNATLQASNWGAQAWYLFSAPLTEGTRYTFTCMAKATDPYTESIFLQSTTGGAQGYPGGFNIDTSWSEVSLSFTPSHNQVDKFTFNFGDFVGTISIDNVKLTAEGSSVNLISNGDFEAGHISGWTSWNNYQSLSAEGSGYSASSVGDRIVEMEPEEKKRVLTNALETWIAGMMEACNGYVTDWDVVNEPMSDSNSSELKYGSSESDESNFYWQDYLGRDYARTVVGLARQYGPENMKLFINDYNLEATYNNNAKCAGLIRMVEYWESDGVTKIDGIGTQMHVSYQMNAEQQKKQEDCVVKMYELLAASGKLIYVSELDMGIKDAEGNTIKTTNTTLEQYQLMADYYKFIVKKYFEIIPVAQQYGITVWATRDSDDNGGWRAGEPIGLWDANYNRKPAYAGFAGGLAGE